MSKDKTNLTNLVVGCIVAAPLRSDEREELISFVRKLEKQQQALLDMYAMKSFIANGYACKNENDCDKSTVEDCLECWRKEALERLEKEITKKEDICEK